MDLGIKKKTWPTAFSNLFSPVDRIEALEFREH